MKLLYITRKYPPMVGGMEQVSAALSREFSKLTDLTLISWSKSQKYLPLFYGMALLRALFIVPRKHITHVHIGDPVLSPIGLLLRALYGVKISITVHGLDIIYAFPGYQRIIPSLVNRYDRVICISNATKRECVKRGISPEKCVVIPCGVDVPDIPVRATKGNLERITGRLLEGKKVLVTVGRLVKRKGVYWFIRDVLPKLPARIVYLVIGEGPEFERIRGLVRDMNISDRVILMGRVPDRDVRVIYDTADTFVMPNIPVSDNFEGFGIVALEASAVGLPVVAARVDGIPQAVTEGKTGFLVPPKDADAFAKYIGKALVLPKRRHETIREYVRNAYSWPAIARQYLRVIRTV